MLQPPSGHSPSSVSGRRRMDLGASGWSASFTAMCHSGSAMPGGANRGARPPNASGTAPELRGGGLGGSRPSAAPELPSHAAAAASLPATQRRKRKRRSRPAAGEPWEV